MSEYKHILIERLPKIAVVKINRPEVRNALNRDCWQELASAFSCFGSDSKIRVIILTGSGNRAFSAGADINVLLERTVEQTLDGENSSVCRIIENCPKPTIAAINGHALGGGCELALSCDIRLAVPKAKIGLTELNVGILPGAGGTQRLSRLVGPGKALEMVLTGIPVAGEYAEKIGLVNRIVDDDKLFDEAVRMAELIAEKSPIAARLAKLTIKNGVRADFNSALLLELLSQSVVFGGDDHIEGLKAFLEKRPPNYAVK